MYYPRWIGMTLLGAVLSCSALADSVTPSAGKKPAAPDDLELVKGVIAARNKYQQSLEQLWAHYRTNGDTEKAKWAEEELRSFHRVPKQVFRLELEVPAPTLQASYNVPEANELYRRAMLYKDKGWGTDYIDNQKRAELLLTQLVTKHPQSDKIGDAAYQLGDLYESKAYKQYRLAATYFERALQWNPTAQPDARIRAARLYDRYGIDRKRARELYIEITTHDTDPKRMQEAQKRLQELGQK